jgi:hypothetical protein
MTWRTLPDVIRKTNRSSFYRLLCLLWGFVLHWVSYVKVFGENGPFQGWRAGLRFSFREAALEGCLWRWAEVPEFACVGVFQTQRWRPLWALMRGVYIPPQVDLRVTNVRVPVLPDLPRSCTLWSQCRFSPVAWKRCCSTLGLLGRRRFTHKEGVQDRCCWVCCAFTL